MRLTAQRVGLCVGLGLVTTLGIAWACATWSDPNLGWPQLSVQLMPGRRSEAVSVQSVFGHTRLNRMTATIVNLQPDYNYLAIETQFDEHARSESQTGWPMRALSCHTRKQVTVRRPNGHNQAWDSTAAVEGDIVELSPWPNFAGSATWRAIPWRPLWPGLIADTALFGAMWLVVIESALALRRRSRRRRGLCPHCAYDLRAQATGSTVCPECGAAPGRIPAPAIGAAIQRPE